MSSAVDDLNKLPFKASDRPASKKKFPGDVNHENKKGGLITVSYYFVKEALREYESVIAARFGFAAWFGMLISSATGAAGMEPLKNSTNMFLDLIEYGHIANFLYLLAGVSFVLCVISGGKWFFKRGSERKNIMKALTGEATPDEMDKMGLN